MAPAAWCVAVPFAVAAAVTAPPSSGRREWKGSGRPGELSATGVAAAGRGCCSRWWCCCRCTLSQASCSSFSSSSRHSAVGWCRCSAAIGNNKRLAVPASNPEAGAVTGEAVLPVGPRCFRRCRPGALASCRRWGSRGAGFDGISRRCVPSAPGASDGAVAALGLRRKTLRSRPPHRTRAVGVSLVGRCRALWPMGCYAWLLARGSCDMLHMYPCCHVCCAASAAADVACSASFADICS